MLQEQFRLVGIKAVFEVLPARVNNTEQLFFDRLVFRVEFVVFCVKMYRAVSHHAVVYGNGSLSLRRGGDGICQKCFSSDLCCLVCRIRAVPKRLQI